MKGKLRSLSIDAQATSSLSEKKYKEELETIKLEKEKLAENFLGKERM